MALHHTKDKGDLGTAKAHADLVGQGYMVLFPATEHAAFDLVAYKSGRFHRVQVKYRTSRAGGVSVQFRSVWADRSGTHMKPSDKSEFDVLCIYCPETDQCYYVRPADHETSVTLRVVPARNGQQLGVLPAERFRKLPI
jgi:PD-(D/E)XK nuclease superfamily protein